VREWFCVISVFAVAKDVVFIPAFRAAIQITPPSASLCGVRVTRRVPRVCATAAGGRYCQSARSVLERAKCVFCECHYARDGGMPEDIRAAPAGGRLPARFEALRPRLIFNQADIRAGQKGVGIR